ncbi:Arc family DNA-binding protein [Acinetobacter gerneri]|uniref:Arc family DNA-binding protein n=1 Tax=Acinetobacter gerneri TaxID=202952 RepID=UPI0028AE6A76|nr:Arc family DNA-binding protein [Acinetobacter gerneri]MDV2441389.1 Arc family DNA-binding protein [Acinetobacter gerneri]
MKSDFKNQAYNLRIPEDLKTFLAKKAKDDGRSLNNFIIELLKEFRQKHENAKA